MLKTYVCHKQVQAAKIVNIDGNILHLEGGGWMRVISEFMEKHKPEVGGYFVQYKDGYQSFSPAKAFEDGYTDLSVPLPPMSIGGAIEAMREGRKVARHGWNGKGMWLLMQKPDAHSKMTLPYIYIEYPEGHPAYPHGSRVPWLASQTDMLAADWIIVE